MGIYYHYASIHDRVIVWWTDHDGVSHERWLEGSIAAAITEAADGYDNSMQRMLQHAVS